MKAKDLHAGLLLLGACAPALHWLEDRVHANPDASFEEVWGDALRYRAPGSKAEEHVGRAWCSWLCRHVGIQVHEGTFSGMPKVNHGPSVTSLDPATVGEAVQAVFAELEFHRHMVSRAETERYNVENTGTNR